MQELGLSYLRLAFHQQSLLSCKASELFIYILVDYLAFFVGLSSDQRRHWALLGPNKPISFN